MQVRAKISPDERRVWNIMLGCAISMVLVSCLSDDVALPAEMPQDEAVSEVSDGSSG